MDCYKGRKGSRVELGQILLTFVNPVRLAFRSDLPWAAGQTLCRFLQESLSPFEPDSHTLPTTTYRDIPIHKPSGSLACGQKSAPNDHLDPGRGTTLRRSHAWRAKHSCRPLLCNQLYCSDISDRDEGKGCQSPKAIQKTCSKTSLVVQQVGDLVSSLQ